MMLASPWQWVSLVSFWVGGWGGAIQELPSRTPSFSTVSTPREGSMYHPSYRSRNELRKGWTPRSHTSRLPGSTVWLQNPDSFP